MTPPPARTMLPLASSEPMRVPELLRTVRSAATLYVLPPMATVVVVPGAMPIIVTGSTAPRAMMLPLEPTRLPDSSTVPMRAPAAFNTFLEESIV